MLVLISRRRRRIPAHDKQFIKSKWKELGPLVRENADKAIFEADKLLDYALKKLGYEGTLGEKMKAADAHFTNSNGLWAAHKLRNKIAHEVGFNLSEEDAKNAMRQFEKALKDLKAIK